MEIIALFMFIAIALLGCGCGELHKHHATRFADTGKDFGIA